jgi:hypothetical protein
MYIDVLDFYDSDGLGEIPLDLMQFFCDTRQHIELQSAESPSVITLLCSPRLGLKTNTSGLKALIFIPGWPAGFVQLQHVMYIDVLDFYGSDDLGEIPLDLMQFFYDRQHRELQSAESPSAITPLCSPCLGPKTNTSGLKALIFIPRWPAGCSIHPAATCDVHQCTQLL